MQLQTDTMTTAEKLDAMEQLWTSLQTEHPLPAMPQWHEDVLSERRRQMESGEMKFSDLDDVRERLEQTDS